MTHQPGICTIEWSLIAPGDWRAKFYTIKPSNLLQSLDYALVMARRQSQSIRLGIIKIDEQEAGLVMILEAGILNNMIHGIILDRGPLWFSGYGSPAHIKLFFEEFLRQLPKRIGRKMRIIPEAAPGDDLAAVFSRHRLKKKRGQGYRTYILDIRPPLEAIRHNFKKSWRGALSKAERSALRIDVNKNADVFLKFYDADRIRRGYRAADGRLLQAFDRHFSAAGNSLTIMAYKNEAPVAGAFFLRHGSTATYQAAWNNADGLKSSAQNLILWQAISYWQERGCVYLDLGGHYETGGDLPHPDLMTFKQGMGGKEIILPGVYG